MSMFLAVHNYYVLTVDMVKKLEGWESRLGELALGVIIFAFGSFPYKLLLLEVQNLFDYRLTDYRRDFPDPRNSPIIGQIL